MNEALFELVKWLDGLDPDWPMSPQMAAQMIINVMREHNVEGSHEILIGVKQR